MSRAETDYDVLIAGGGMVGATLALALAPSGWRIALVDPADITGGGSPSFDDRATALSWSSRQLLTAIGLWPQIESAGAAIHHIHVSEQGRFGRARLHAGDMGQAALGHVVPNRAIGSALAAALEDQPNIHAVRTGANGGPRTAVDADGVERVWIDTPQGPLAGRLLVVADGARSRLRDALSIPARTTDFPHCALVANLEVSRPHQGWAYERFTPSGPLAMLPLPTLAGGMPRVNTVMSVPASEAAAWRRMPDATLLATIQARFGSHLGPLRRVGERGVYPLTQVRARHLTARRSVLAGNAAMALHPVAGQGFNLALRGVGDLADRLLRIAARDGDPGDAGMLAAHESQRHRDLSFTGGWTRGLVQGFTSGLPGAGVLRSAGLLALDRSPWLRRAFTARAMGLMPALSLLSRGVGPND